MRHVRNGINQQLIGGDFYLKRGRCGKDVEHQVVSVYDVIEILFHRDTVRSASGIVGGGEIAHPGLQCLDDE